MDITVRKGNTRSTFYTLTWLIHVFDKTKPFCSFVLLYIWNPHVISNSSMYNTPLYIRVVPIYLDEFIHSIVISTTLSYLLNYATGILMYRKLFLTNN